MKPELCTDMPAPIIAGAMDESSDPELIAGITGLGSTTVKQSDNIADCPSGFTTVTEYTPADAAVRSIVKVICVPVTSLTAFTGRDSDPSPVTITITPSWKFDPAIPVMLVKVPVKP
jgi:hypothetical protein